MEVDDFVSACKKGKDLGVSAGAARAFFKSLGKEEQVETVSLEGELMEVFNRAFDMEEKHWEKLDSSSHDGERDRRASQQLTRTKEARARIGDILKQHFEKEGL